VNNGFMNTGDGVTFNGPIAGHDVHVSGSAAPPLSAAPRERKADVAVLTILGEEIRAVEEALRGLRDYRSRRLPYGPLAREAWAPTPDGRRVRVAAVQTYTRGTESAAVAYQSLVREYNPYTVLLVGIAGGIGKCAIGDVVISDEVIMYDARKETADRIYRRGQAQAVAVPLGYRVNDFFADPSASISATYKILRGPVGSGNAVVADEESDITRWLREVNDKVLAVETEAAGVAQSFHESIQQDAVTRGWLAVRGISDRADEAKNDDDHDRAAAHAAEVMARLIPFLAFAD
jgi:adenosylhomocysteine nucleosidase